MIVAQGTIIFLYNGKAIGKYKSFQFKKLKHQQRLHITN